jgi:hypothetical protein
MGKGNRFTELQIGDADVGGRTTGSLGVFKYEYLSITVRNHGTVETAIKGLVISDGHASHCKSPALYP